MVGIDGNTADEQNIDMLLIGNDKPGSIVVLTVAKGDSEVVQVSFFHIASLSVLTKMQHAS